MHFSICNRCPIGIFSPEIYNIPKSFKETFIAVIPIRIVSINGVVNKCCIALDIRYKAMNPLYDSRFCRKIYSVCAKLFNEPFL